MPKITFNCINCGKQCESYDNQSNGKYCSQACYRAYKRQTQIEKTCPICARKFMGVQSQLYCSDSCKRKRDHNAEKTHIEIVCPRCGAIRVSQRPRYYTKPTLCKKCAGEVAREKSPPLKGSESHSWKGGRRTDMYGYIKVHAPGHRYADTTNYVREHIHVICEAYGTEYLENNGGVVHHINGDKADNRLENLHVCTDKRNKEYVTDLLRIAYELVKIGVIEFVDGEYCCPLLSDDADETAQIR